MQEECSSNARNHVREGFHGRQGRQQHDALLEEAARVGIIATLAKQHVAKQQRLVVGQEFQMRAIVLVGRAGPAAAISVLAAAGSARAQSA
jgi:hypothetical protein